MSLTYTFNTARDLLEKLKRDVQALDERVTGDRFFNMVITAYHIIDWLKNDPSVPPEAKMSIASMYDSTYVALCRDIANASKHYELREKYNNREAEYAESRRGFGRGRFGKGSLGVGEDSISIRGIDGSQINSLELAHGVLEVWVSFFDKNGIT